MMPQSTNVDENENQNLLTLKQIIDLQNQMKMKQANGLAL